MKRKEMTFTGTTDPAERPYEAQHRQLARRAASEGFVLLKNENGILPFAPGKKLALYGAGASKTIKGGTGSGDVNERHSVSIREGMENAGFQVTTGEWIREFDEIYAKARED